MTLTITAQPAELLSQVAGITDGNGDIGGPNDTTVWNMRAADLGIMWDDGNGNINIAFGDNYGAPWVAPVTGGPPSTPPAYTADWCMSALAKSSNLDFPTYGVVIDSMITTPSGSRKGLINPTGAEITVIPTAGIRTGGGDAIAYMGVTSWGNTPGDWTTDCGGLAFSTDGGQNWYRSTQWNNAGGDANFQQSALVNYSGYVYKYGTPNGRFGAAYLSRVPTGNIGSKAAYRYWSGAAWVASSAGIAPVIPGPVGELSVWYNQRLGTWIATYLNQTTGSIVMRTAPAAQGPWSAEQVLMAGVGWQTYGAFIHPWSGGTDLYFVVSQWGPYQTYLMHSALYVTC